MNSDRYSFKFKDTLKENAGLSVYNTGSEQCDKNHGWGPALRDHYLIHFVRSGQGTFTYNKQTYTLKAGDLFYIAPSQMASYRADPKDPWFYTWVGFNGTDARRLINMTGFSNQAPVLHSKTPETTEHLLQDIAAASGHTARRSPAGRWGADTKAGRDAGSSAPSDPGRTQGSSRQRD